MRRTAYCKPGFVSQDDLANIYSAADLHISASQMETLGNTVLESLACGTPVITPKAQGFVDSIEHGVNGLMWKTNDLDDAVKMVQKLRDEPELRKDLQTALMRVSNRCVLMPPLTTFLIGMRTLLT